MISAMFAVCRSTTRPRGLPLPGHDLSFAPFTPNSCSVVANGLFTRFIRLSMV